MENILEERTTYEVNDRTMIISPKVTAHGICSIVKEIDDEFIVLQKPTDIIKHSCEFYGSSYGGRVQGTKYLTGITHKSPIAVNPSDNNFFFPTISAKRHECIWISHRHVEKICKAPQSKVKVHFSNSSSDTLNVSARSFENQRNRTAQVQSAYSARKASKQESRQVDIVCENEIKKYIQEKTGIKCLKLQIIIK